MAAEAVILSICVPTFNRRAHLRECLSGIFEAVSRCSPGLVEVVVSDNASEDGTGQMVQSLRDARHEIRYVRQERNIGPHANFRAAAGLARGEYVWIFGDDDKMAPGAVEEVLKRVRGGADAVVCNVAVYSEDFGRLIKPRFVRRADDLVFSGPGEAMGVLGAHAGYISGSVLKRRDFLGVPEQEYLSFSEDGSPFMYAAYCVFRSCRRVEFIAAPLVMNRSSGPEIGRQAGGACGRLADDSGWDRIFIEGFPRTLDELARRGYGAGAVRAAKTRMVFDYLLPRLLLLKQSGGSGPRLAGKVVARFGCSWAFWLLFLPASLLPAAVLMGLRRARRCQRGGD